MSTVSTPLHEWNASEVKIKYEPCTYRICHSHPARGIIEKGLKEKMTDCAQKRYNYAGLSPELNSQLARLHARLYDDNQNPKPLLDMAIFSTIAERFPPQIQGSSPDQIALGETQSEPIVNSFGLRLLYNAWQVSNTPPGQQIVGIKVPNLIKLLCNFQ